MSEKRRYPHEPIPFCDGSGKDACVACSTEVDLCVPWPCERVVQAFRSFAEAGGKVLAVLEMDLCQFCNRAPYSHAIDCPQEKMVRCWDDLLEIGAVR